MLRSVQKEQIWIFLQLYPSFPRFKHKTRKTRYLLKMGQPEAKKHESVVFNTPGEVERCSWLDVAQRVFQATGLLGQKGKPLGTRSVNGFIFPFSHKVFWLPGSHLTHSHLSLGLERVSSCFNF